MPSAASGGGEDADLVWDLGALEEMGHREVQEDWVDSGEWAVERGPMDSSTPSAEREARGATAVMVERAAMGEQAGTVPVVPSMWRAANSVSPSRSWLSIKPLEARVALGARVRLRA